MHNAILFSSHPHPYLLPSFNLLNISPSIQNVNVSSIAQNYIHWSTNSTRKMEKHFCNTQETSTDAFRKRQVYLSHVISEINVHNDIYASTALEYTKSMKKFLSAPKKIEKRKLSERNGKIGWGSGEENWVDDKKKTNLSQFFTLLILFLNGK